MTITLPQALKESRCIIHIDLGINTLAQLFIKLTQYGKIAFIVKLVIPNELKRNVHVTLCD